MDTALKLRIAVEKQELLTPEQITADLAASLLVKKLTEQPLAKNPLSNLFNLTSLAEIPFAGQLTHTKQLINYVETVLATPNGFSYSEDPEQIVPCYNAMLLEAYSRLGLGRTPAAQRALKWIKNYQLFERNQQTSWTGSGIQKHGGCLKAVPCYIGIGKTVRALLTYQEFQKASDSEVATLINQGLAYMLKHQFFLRLSSNQPISKYITASIFPQSYFLSLTDLVYIVGKGKMTEHPAAQKLLQLLEEKRLVDTNWKLDHIYSYKGYISFENRRKPSEWLSALYPLWLADRQAATVPH